ncbi:MAG: hypothetical protein ACPG4Z_06225 [Chitinophagales bacterium]
MKNLNNQVGKTLSLRPDLLEEIKTEEELLLLIERYVQELIDFDFPSLLRLLYRIDVGEEKVKKAIDLGGAQNATKEIALLIFEREKEKAVSRAADKAEEESNDWIF